MISLARAHECRHPIRQGQVVVVVVHRMLDTPLADEDAARHTLDRTQGIDRLEGMGGGSAIPIVALCSRSLSDQQTKRLRAYLRLTPSLSPRAEQSSPAAARSLVRVPLPSLQVCVHGPWSVCLITTPPSNCPGHTATTTAAAAAHLHPHYSRPASFWPTAAACHPHHGTTRLAFRCLLFTHPPRPTARLTTAVAYPLAPSAYQQPCLDSPGTTL